MATQIPVLMDSNQKADADLSAKQFFFVKKTSTGVDVCSGATDKPWGVLQNAPTSGQAAVVMRVGISKVKAGGTIAVGALIGTDSSGKGDSKTAGTDTTEYVVGVADEAAVSGDIFTAGINCLSPARAA